MLTDFHRGGATVMVSPARGFYATPGLGADQVRIAYVLKSEDLRDAVGILAAGLETYSRDRSRPPVGTTALPRPKGPDFSTPVGS
jgi:hypothetical protein